MGKPPQNAVSAMEPSFGSRVFTRYAGAAEKDV